MVRDSITFLNIKGEVSSQKIFLYRYVIRLMNFSETLLWFNCFLLIHFMFGDSRR